MAAKQYYKWDASQRRWKIDWGYEAPIATRGLKSHQIGQFLGRKYTFTYGADPKNTPDEPPTPTPPVWFTSKGGAWIGGTPDFEETYGHVLKGVPYGKLAEIDFGASRGRVAKGKGVAYVARAADHKTLPNAINRPNFVHEETSVPSVPTSTNKFQYGYGNGPVRAHVRAEDPLFGDDALIAAAEALAKAYDAKFGRGASRFVRLTVEGTSTWDSPHKFVLEPRTETPEERRSAQHRDMMARFTRVGFGSREARHALSSAVLGRKVTTNAISALTDTDRERIIAKLTELEG